MNKLLFKAPVDENGNTEQLVIDTERRNTREGISSSSAEGYGSKPNRCSTSLSISSKKMISRR